jgi:hypothetical protein
VDPYDSVFRFGSGGLINPLIGRPLRIVYATQPQPFTSEQDDMVNTTGLPPGVDDVLILGVTAKAVPGLDISRAQLTTMEQSDRSRIVPPNQGINIGKYLMALYEDRLKNEAQSLRKRYRTQMVRTW